MKILIFGASGFIGSDFIKRFSEGFEKIFIFTRSNNLLNESSNVVSVGYEDLVNTTDVSCVLHFAFDHLYKENKKLADAVHTVCKLNKCSLIYLSSFVVRDFLSGPSLSLEPSRLNDPYTIEKIQVKRYLETKFKNSNLIMLQIEPGVVFGLRGGWFDHVSEALSKEFIWLPNSGGNVSPFIYVGELSTYIYEKIIHGDQTSGSVLITGGSIKTWEEFYSLYGKILGRRVRIHSLNSSRLHPRLVVHFLMYLVIFTKLGKAIFKFTPILKSYFKKLSRSSCNNDVDFITKKGPYRSYGITHVLQSTNFEKKLAAINNDFTETNMFTESFILKEMDSD